MYYEHHGGEVAEPLTWEEVRGVALVLVAVVAALIAGLSWL